MAKGSTNNKKTIQKVQSTRKKDTSVAITETKLRTSAKRYPIDWQEQLQQITNGMREHQIDLGNNRNADGFEARMSELTGMDSDINTLEIRLASMRDNRQQKRLEFWQIASATRTAVAGLFGPDSLEYQALGGIRSSERKRRQPKPKTS